MAMLVSLTAHKHFHVGTCRKLAKLVVALHWVMAIQVFYFIPKALDRLLIAVFFTLSMYTIHV